MWEYGTLNNIGLPTPIIKYSDAKHLPPLIREHPKCHPPSLAAVGWLRWLGWRLAVGFLCEYFGVLWATLEYIGLRWRTWEYGTLNNIELPLSMIKAVI